jgi:hypothetical protein
MWAILLKIWRLEGREMESSARVQTVVFLTAIVSLLTGVPFVNQTAIFSHGLQ